MRAGILAAGLGERLAPLYPAQPKALLRVAGRPLLRHALEAVAAAGALEVRIALNRRDAEAVERELVLEPPPLPVTMLCRSTASSLETFAWLAPWLREGGRHAILAMVDGVFAPGAVAGLGREVAALAAEPEGATEGLIGVTDREDDDRPLRVAFDPEGRIRAIGPGAAGSRHATAGLYCLPARAFGFAPSPADAARARLRDFLARLLDAGLRLRAVPLGRVVDVDRPDDLAEAEALQRFA